MSEIPSDLRYTAEHEWVKDQGDGVVRVVITAYAAEALGDVVYVSLPSPGEAVTGGQSCGEVESTKSVSDLYSRPTARSSLSTRPSTPPRARELRPVRRGWMYDLRLTDPAAVDGMLDADGYGAILD